MYSERISADYALEQVGGYGIFQAMITVLVSFSYISMSQSIYFTTFGTHNPGWRCLDNTTSTTITITPGTDPTNEVIHSVLEKNQTSIIYFTDTCQGFETCQNIEFNPEISTIVTEWGLVCEKSWIPSYIVSMQLLGNILGSLGSTYLADVLGRKWTIYSSICLAFLFNIVCALSTSWNMLAWSRFVIGMSVGTTNYLPIVYIIEFVPRAWRAKIASLPILSVSGILAAAIALTTKDWRLTQYINTAMLLLGVFPVLWIPQSFRRLVVIGNHDKSLRVLEKIANWNRSKFQIELHQQLLAESEGRTPKFSMRCLFLDLFKKKTKLYTPILSYTFLSVGFVYFVTSFELRFLPWDVYTNLIVLSLVELSSNVIACIFPDRFGRRNTSVHSCLAMVVCLWCVVAAQLVLKDQVKSIVTFVFTIVARVCQNVICYVLIMYSSELYPTVMRGTALSFFYFIFNLAGTAAPHIIPHYPNNMCIAFMVLATVAVFNCAFLLLLPETKKKRLPDILKSSSENNKEVYELNSSKDPLFNSIMNQM